VGGRVIVFGSGGARNIPEGFSRERAEAQLVEFLELAAEHVGKNGMKIAIEPLNRSESNVLNSVAEAVELAQRVNRDAIGVLVDFYHLTLEEEPFDHIAAAGSVLIHAHVADSGRLYPGSGSYPYPAFYGALRGAGYDERISIECNWRDFAGELPRAMRFLRESYSRFTGEGA
jgi:sugar phosphate isomerase/epimerase